MRNNHHIFAIRFFRHEEKDKNHQGKCSDQSTQRAIKPLKVPVVPAMFYCVLSQVKINSVNGATSYPSLWITVKSMWCQVSRASSDPYFNQIMISKAQAHVRPPDPSVPPVRNRSHWNSRLDVWSRSLFILKQETTIIKSKRHQKKAESQKLDRKVQHNSLELDIMIVVEAFSTISTPT